VSAFVDEERARFGVEPICRELEVSSSAYYQRRAGPLSRRATEDAWLSEQIRRVHKANYEAYGSRRVWKALGREGIDVGRDRTRRLMRAAGLEGAKRRGKPWRTTVCDPAAVRAPDLVERDFSASRPDELWVCDFTYGRCWEGVVYFAFVKDAYSRMICGWQFATHMRTELVLDALEMALWARDPEREFVHHSDQGSQYTSFHYTQRLADAGAAASVGSVGDAYDNALAESFVDSFKTELLKDRIWRTRSELELAIVEYVHWFNNVRLHESLGDLPPVEFEALYAAHQREEDLPLK
jgi:putative transposase